MLNSSMEIFLRFVLRDKTGNLTQENIISTECFNLWISTRESTIKYPVPAFKRTVSSHLRGADERAPFPKDVEKSLLKKYRQRDQLDKQIDPFSFIKSDKPIKRTYSRKNPFSYPYGYHEKQKQRKKKSENLAIVDTKVLKSMEEMIGLSANDLTLLHEAASITKLSSVATLVSYILPKLRKSCKYYSAEYIIAKESERYFRKQCKIRMVHFIVDFKNMKILQDTIGEAKNLQPKNFFTLGLSMTEFFSTFIYVHHNLATKGFSWHKSFFTVKGKAYETITYAERKQHLDFITCQILWDRPVYGLPKIVSSKPFSS
eukprot:snap_masked-scaffold_6-processed-gene-1.9-mRNA-1 protein AED:0.00 eAED:0.00 QI:125/0.5/0.66/1/1/1/3/227/315